MSDTPRRRSLQSADSAFSKTKRGAREIVAGSISALDASKHRRKNISRALTNNIVECYLSCNPAFKAVDRLPQRVLTVPSEPISNNGYDNEEANLICRVHDKIQCQNATYTILDLLGTGTFGQVFRCQKEGTKEVVAVKVIKNKAAYHSQGLLEIKIAKLLNNTHDPNDERHIVRLLESFEFKGHICLVFELLSMSLLDILTQNQFRGLPLTVVQRFTRQIIAALVTLEDANIIHCDLKPENILLTPPKMQRSRSSRSRSKTGSSSSSRPHDPSTSSSSTSKAASSAARDMHRIASSSSGDKHQKDKPEDADSLPISREEMGSAAPRTASASEASYSGRSSMSPSKMTSPSPPALSLGPYHNNSSNASTTSSTSPTIRTPVEGSGGGDSVQENGKKSSPEAEGEQSGDPMAESKLHQTQTEHPTGASAGSSSGPSASASGASNTDSEGRTTRTSTETQSATNERKSSSSGTGTGSMGTSPNERKSSSSGSAGASPTRNSSSSLKSSTPVWSDVKVIDFGSACFEGRTMYSYIQSRFYRSPEVLLGVPYNGAIDMWSLACVCAEMYLGLPLFPGVSQHNQLTRIVDMLGTPPEALIEGKNGLKYFKRVPVQETNEGENAASSPANGTTDGEQSSHSGQEPRFVYRLKTAEEYAADTKTEVPVLRKYLRYSRLEDVIMKCPLANKSKMTPEQRKDEMSRRLCFLNFLQGLFRLNPFERLTAKQAASHPFITNAPFSGSFTPPADTKLNERKLAYLLQMQQRGLTKPVMGRSGSDTHLFQPLSFRRLTEPNELQKAASAMTVAEHNAAATNVVLPPQPGALGPEEKPLPPGHPLPAGAGVGADFPQLSRRFTDITEDLHRLHRQDEANARPMLHRGRAVIPRKNPEEESPQRSPQQSHVPWQYGTHAHTVTNNPHLVHQQVGGEYGVTHTPPMQYSAYSASTPSGQWMPVQTTHPTQLFDNTGTITYRTTMHNTIMPGQSPGSWQYTNLAYSPQMVQRGNMPAQPQLIHANTTSSVQYQQQQQVQVSMGTVPSASHFQQGMHGQVNMANHHIPHTHPSHFPVTAAGPNGQQTSYMYANPNHIPGMSGLPPGAIAVASSGTGPNSFSTPTGSYGANSLGGSMQEAMIMTDFGQALMRPEIDERRLMMSQQFPMPPPQNGWQAAAGGGGPVQRLASNIFSRSFENKMKSMDAAAELNMQRHGPDNSGARHGADSGIRQQAYMVPVQQQQSSPQYQYQYMQQHQQQQQSPLLSSSGSMSAMIGLGRSPVQTMISMSPQSNLGQLHGYTQYVLAQPPMMGIVPAPDPHGSAGVPTTEPSTAEKNVSFHLPAPPQRAGSGKEHRPPVKGPLPAGSTVDLNGRTRGSAATIIKASPAKPSQSRSKADEVSESLADWDPFFASDDLELRHGNGNGVASAEGSAAGSRAASRRGSGAEIDTEGEGTWRTTNGDT